MSLNFTNISVSCSDPMKLSLLCSLLEPRGSLPISRSSRASRILSSSYQLRVEIKLSLSQLSQAGCPVTTLRPARVSYLEEGTFPPSVMNLTDWLLVGCDRGAAGGSAHIFSNLIYQSIVDNYTLHIYLVLR